MSLSPELAERLTAGVAQLVRTGRVLGHRASHEVYGDLPSSAWALLVPLERDGEQRCSALAGTAGVDGSVVSRHLAVLERAGYVERRPDPRDGRASLVRLSPAGADVLRASRAVRSAWATDALGSWDEHDARLLAELIERLTADLAAAARGADLTSA